MIKAKIHERQLIVEGGIASDSVKFETIKFSFPDNWEEYQKTVVFSNEDGVGLNVVLNTDNVLCVSENECYIPHEVIKTPGFSVSVFGIKDDSVATTTKEFVRVLESGYQLGDEPSDPTPNEYQQIINLTSNTMNIAQSVRDDADSGLFKGEKGDKGDRGESGVYYGESEPIENSHPLWVYNGDDEIDMSHYTTLEEVENLNYTTLKEVENLNYTTLEEVENLNYTTLEEVENLNYTTLEEVKSEIPYIVESGTSGIWTYRKWSDGTAECWGRYSDFTLNSTTSSGGQFVGSTPRFDFPFSFTERPVLNANCYGSDYCSLTIWELSNVGVKFYTKTNVSSTKTTDFFMSAKGYWK